MHKHKGLKITAIVLAVLLAGSATFFFVYTGNYYQATPATTAAGVEIVIEEGYTALVPEEYSQEVGFIFYPGALVDENAYLTYLSEVAAGGYLCAVVSVPFHLAILKQNAAGAVTAAYAGIENWVVGGHSLGGVVAASYAEKHPETITGLVLLASYPSANLSATGLSALSITTTNDEVLNRNKYEQAKGNLPPDTEFITLEGGNHAGYGNYGPQKGDGEATLPAAEQQRQTAAATLLLLDRLAA